MLFSYYCLYHLFHKYNYNIIIILIYVSIISIFFKFAVNKLLIDGLYNNKKKNLSNLYA